MKKTLLVAVLFVSVFILSGCSLGDPVVKKSNTGICHQKGTDYYNKTKNFTAYSALSDCLNSGGRMPKR